MFKSSHKNGRTSEISEFELNGNEVKFLPLKSKTPLGNQDSMDEDGQVYEPKIWHSGQCCPRRTALEKKLFFFLFVTLIACTVLVLFLAIEKGSKRENNESGSHIFGQSKNDKPSVCLTPDCVEVAASLISKMDPTVDPCVNFYEYACGGWKEKSVIPDEEAGLFIFTQLSDRLNIMCKGIIEKEILDTDIEAVVKAKNFYKSCMNEAFVVLPKRLAVNQPVLGIEDEEYYKSNTTGKITAAYIDFMTSMATQLRPDHDRAEAYKSMLEVFQFEQQLYEIIQCRLHRTPSNCYLLYLQIDWLRYLEGVFEGTSVDLKGYDEYVVVWSVPFMKKIGAVLEKTPKRVVANYLMARLVMDFTLHLGENEREFYQKYLRITRGEEREPSRWKFCVDKTNNYIGGAFSYPFIEKYFDEESKRVADEMIADLRDSLEELINNTHWMDDYTKANALEKAKSIRQMVGYDKDMVDVDKINKLYERISIDSENYFENIIGAYEENAYQNMINLRKPIDKYKWPGKTVIIVNAFYAHTRNLIVFPAGILQSPFYSTKSTQSMNYGGIGVVIGHELTHGFDNRGRQFNQDGNLKVWWSNSSIKAYIEKAECFVEQYSNYTVKTASKKIPIDGRQTLGENIADNGGLKESYMAYRKWVEKNGEEERLPGLDLSHDQIFFLNFGQIWCSKAKEEEIIHQISVADHAYADYRVIGSVSNSEAFAKAYNCPVGSPMNPKKKCAVW
ncbi:membrane metallo-endopeptidase-like 1 [Anneissia japonica]|uniref:membrane metallo-endopeptidase-like 1 n=1 Tax=Anneissia japonica TaxID=1529436 RepID=UPI0014256189|nr:membrane metallo-endopeptidase-like 1 [Anneissia japonica]